MDAHGMSVRMLITEGTRADCSQAEYLIEGIDAEYLFADKGYDSDKIIEKAKEGGMTPVSLLVGVGFGAVIMIVIYINYVI